MQYQCNTSAILAHYKCNTGQIAINYNCNWILINTKSKNLCKCTALHWYTSRIATTKKHRETTRAGRVPIVQCTSKIIRQAGLDSYSFSWCNICWIGKCSVLETFVLEHLWVSRSLRAIKYWFSCFHKVLLQWLSHQFLPTGWSLWWPWRVWWSPPVTPHRSVKSTTSCFYSPVVYCLCLFCLSSFSVLPSFLFLWFSYFQCKNFCFYLRFFLL